MPPVRFRIAGAIRPAQLRRAQPPLRMSGSVSIETTSKPLRRRNHVRRPQRRQYPHQMLDVVDLDIEVEGVERAVARGLVHADDIGAMAAENAGDDGERARLVL